MVKVAQELENAKERRFPVDAEEIFGNRTSLLEMRVTLPAGWKAQLPAGVTAASPFGTYESSYAQVGRDLILTRKTIGTRGVFPPGKAKDVAAWFRAVAKDDAKIIVIAKK